ncbi:MAG: response regulator [bacterium]
MDRMYSVLVLDDEPIVCKRLKSALAKDGFDVEVLSNSREALNRIQEKEFDVVVTDFRMDDVDGIDVLEHALSRSERTKVVLITGYATLELAHEALAKGAFDVIAKPFQPKDLRKIVARAVKELPVGISENG